jgi:hypothetical protein
VIPGLHRTSIDSARMQRGKLIAGSSPVMSLRIQQNLTSLKFRVDLFFPPPHDVSESTSDGLVAHVANSWTGSLFYGGGLVLSSRHNGYNVSSGILSREHHQRSKHQEHQFYDIATK